MKGKLINDPSFFPDNEMPYSLLRGKEYLILGISENGYLVYDELNRVNFAPIDRIEITDNNQPDFWEIDESDKSRLVPKEWHWEYFLSLNGEPFLEIWDYEIWSVTQFAKGLERYELPIFPTNFRRALDTEYKLDLINAYFKIAVQYDILEETDLMLSYTISKSYRNVSNEILTNQNNRLVTESITGFEIVKDLLKNIGEPLQHSCLKVTSEDFEGIRNRILFSIWSLFGTKEFDVYKLTQQNTESSYLLTKEENTYVLKFDWST